MLNRDLAAGSGRTAFDGDRDRDPVVVAGAFGADTAGAALPHRWGHRGQHPDQHVEHDAVQVATIFAYLALLAISIHQRIPWPLVAYTAGVIMITLGGSGVITTTRARYLVPAFIVFLPVALGLAQRKNGTVWATLVSAALVSGWLGGYALVLMTLRR